jgi:hypothetical protein
MPVKSALADGQPSPRCKSQLKARLRVCFYSALDHANDFSLGNSDLSRYSFALITPVFFAIWRNMSSSKTVTPQEVSSFLERLSASSTKTLAAFSDSKCSIGSSVSGQLSVDDAGIVSVRTRGTFSVLESSLLETSMDELANASCTYLSRSEAKEAPFFNCFDRELPFTFGILFNFPNGSKLALFEIAQHE